MENSMEVPQNIKNATSGTTFKANKNTNSKSYLKPHFHSSIIYNSQEMET